MGRLKEFQGSRSGKAISGFFLWTSLDHNPQSNVPVSENMIAYYYSEYTRETMCAVLSHKCAQWYHPLRRLSVLFSVELSHSKSQIPIRKKNRRVKPHLSFFPHSLTIAPGYSWTVCDRAVAGVVQSRGRLGLARTQANHCKDPYLMPPVRSGLSCSRASRGDPCHPYHSQIAT